MIGLTLAQFDHQPTRIFLGDSGSQLTAVIGENTVGLGAINPPSQNPFPGVAVTELGDVWLCGNDGIVKYNGKSFKLIQGGTAPHLEEPGRILVC